MPCLLKILLTAGDDLIGCFQLSSESKWTFRYYENFKQSLFLPIEDFPLTENTYGHEICSKWLSSRISTINDELKIDGSIKLKNSQSRSVVLGVNIVH